MVTVLCNDSEIEVEERCSLRDLRPGAGGVRLGDGTGIHGYYHWTCVTHAE